MSWRQAAVLLGWIPLGLGVTGVAGCSDSCDDVNCGSGVMVVWSDGEFPSDGQVRVCANGVCDAPTLPSDGVVGADSSVGLASGTAEDEVDVRLESLRPDGSVAESLAGSGEKSGGCCPAVVLTPAKDGRTLVVLDEE